MASAAERRAAQRANAAHARLTHCAHTCTCVAHTVVPFLCRLPRGLVRCEVPALLLSVPAHLGLRVAMPDRVVLLLARFRALSAAWMAAVVAVSRPLDRRLLTTRCSSRRTPRVSWRRLPWWQWTSGSLGRMFLRGVDCFLFPSERTFHFHHFSWSVWQIAFVVHSPGALARFLVSAAAETKSASFASATDIDHYTTF